ncbi:putative nicotinate phosphoribosyltransferase (plasmid) [Tautonia plasticadhaerens]|uniref:Nicotinamide phosphoribosyltransferase n=1 Tax=Tautonia plasticadhaerens TaxID=2527974 RepID=A0A518HEG2_9BACT|nr:putative nicotinate phosphoribosyltransferase [Tautonia plasticadhaerens]
MCMGTCEGEIETFRRLITRLYPAGIVSIVSDTWDFWQVNNGFAAELKPEILAREGKLVFRPDSGDPVRIICGDPDAPADSPAFKGAVECLWGIFGGTTTEKGFRVLDGHVGLIYGDSITLARAEAILAGLEAKGIASNNVVFGVGSYTYQYATRDTFGFAVKSTYGEINGGGREIYKDPKTDDGVKKSARGLLKVMNVDGVYCLADRQELIDADDCSMQKVFCDGKLLIDDSIAAVRARLTNKAA